MSEEVDFKSTARWKALLGIHDHEKTAKFWNKSIDVTAVPESRVIDQDVMRTRSDETFFRNGLVRGLLRLILLRYCAHYDVRYMQGLNEIIAPLLLLQLQKPCSGGDDNAQSEGKGEIHEEGSTEFEKNNEIIDQFAMQYLENINIIEKFLAKMSPVLFSTEGVQALQSQLAYFHLFLYFFEADLSSRLTRECMTADIYAPSWFITLFARRSDTDIALYLWWKLLHGAKAHLILFTGIAFVQLHKELLMILPNEQLPEVIVNLRFETKSDIDLAITQAIKLEAATPPSVLSSLIKHGFDTTTTDYERAKGLYEVMYQPCVMVDAIDVASSIMENQKATCMKSRSKIRYLLLDCRDTERHEFFVDGSLVIRLDIVNEIYRAAESQQKSTDNVPDIGQLTPAAAATLALLWSCRDEETHFTVVGSEAISLTLPAPSEPAIPVASSSSPVGPRKIKAKKDASIKMKKSTLFTSGKDGNTAITQPSYRNTELPAPIPKKPDHKRSTSNVSNTSNISITSDCSIDSSSRISEDGDDSVALSSGRNTPAIDAHATSTSSPAGMISREPSTDMTHSKPKEEIPPEMLAEEMKRIAKINHKLPSFQLATSLLILGFSRVSIIKGNMRHFPRPENQSSPRTSAEELASTMRCSTDGFSTLAHTLVTLGAEVDEGVIRVPQDPFLAQKVHQFSLSQSSSSHMSAYTRKIQQDHNTPWGKSTPAGYSKYSNKGGLVSPSGLRSPQNSACTPDDREPIEKGMTGLETVLRRLGGLHEDFLENMLLPQMHNAMRLTLGTPTGPASSSRANVISPYTMFESTPDKGATPRTPGRGGWERNAVVSDLLGKLHTHSNAQAAINGASVARDTKRAIYNLAPIADDISALQKKTQKLKKILATTVDCSDMTISILTDKCDINPKYKELAVHSEFTAEETEDDADVHDDNLQDDMDIL